jgi:predicted nucleic acid-binding protein
VRTFLDTNVLVYATSNDPRCERAQALIAAGGTTSVQVLNELVNVLRKKLKRDWGAIEKAVSDFRNVLDPVLPLTPETHDAAIALAREHSLSFYDALIVASALEANCEVLFTEDMQHGRTIGTLTVRNPFIGS